MVYTRPAGRNSSPHAAAPQRHYFTPADVMAALQLSETKVRKLLRSGELGSVKIGPIYRISPEDLGKFLEDRYRGGKK